MNNHVRLHLYLEAVCLSRGFRPRDWGEAKRVCKVLSRDNTVPSFFDFYPEQPRDDAGIAEQWLRMIPG